MARRIYRIGDLTFEFEEGAQPGDAVAVDATPPAEAPTPTPRKASTRKPKG